MVVMVLTVVVHHHVQVETVVVAVVPVGLVVTLRQGQVTVQVPAVVEVQGAKIIGVLVLMFITQAVAGVQELLAEDRLELVKDRLAYEGEVHLFVIPKPVFHFTQMRGITIIDF